MNIEEYYGKYDSRIVQASERLFIEEFLYPLLKSNIGKIEPQYVFIDSTGKNRRIDFAYHDDENNVKIAFEVNGESYHAEGIIPNEQFDDNLFRQNEILGRGYKLLRFSYNQLQSPRWRPIVKDSIRNLITKYAPNLLSEYSLKPNAIQNEVLEVLDYFRNVRKLNKGIIIMPTGTGKTILSALDAKRMGGRVLFVVHRLDILTQSIEAYRKVWGNLNAGKLTGQEKYREKECDVLFASKDTLRQSEELAKFTRDYFDYIVIDEVHHSQTLSYQALLKYFQPKFTLGMTATPDRTDRKDIFELFEYHNIYEISLDEVIERGLLVPYTYIGLTDNVDYSKIRYQNQSYRVDDLERLLIIPERNEAILKAYLDEDKGAGDKAIGFCVSIEHADRMAEFFNDNGVKAIAIHSRSANRDNLIESFRNNNYQVVFTVDLFNEGIDFPNIRVLLFLRPTESKTVFLQQLGRGLRLCTGKDRVRILDFIGNYKRANQVRKYLAKSSSQEVKEENGKRIKKLTYEYSTGCEVKFDEQVEEILNRQDAEDLGIDKDDLKNAYFELAERLQRKPTKQDLDEQGKYKSNLYTQSWQTWLKFLQDVDEYTEASYHYPQGTHLGHILSILWYFGLPSQDKTHFDKRYIRMRGKLDKDDRISGYQRQLKYKLQAAMELGILEDDRKIPDNQDWKPTLTALGFKLRQILEPALRNINLSFPSKEGDIPSTQMVYQELYYNQFIMNIIQRDKRAKKIVLELFINVPAVQQMIAFLYHIVRNNTVEKQRIYQDFFSTPFVKRFCEQEGIEPATEEASKRRCPFLLNILNACGIIEINRSDITIKKLMLIPNLVKSIKDEDETLTQTRYEAVKAAWPNNANMLDNHNLSIVRELFGSDFLTENYHLTDLDYIEV